ncbi:MAG TPA: BadF/BadG/BcrA/BcrD ATPase family protein [Ktedonobacterales bacterium]|nr:BadF/BadG/BcrA/BcrD ATPase family protein [Ktedonobacterales bacterium]
MSGHGALFLGVDGGGTTTRALVVDADGVVRGRGTSGGANQEVIGSDAAVEAVRAAVREALGNSGAELPVRTAWIGLAGVDSAAAAESLRPALAPLADYVRISNDAELLLGVLPGGVGVALIAGTGSIALGCNAAGETARAGGWGHIFGDEGSGYAIGAAALRATAHDADHIGQPTTLGERITRAWHLHAPTELLGYIYGRGGFDKAAIAGLAPLVFEAAADGDLVADLIVQQQARDLVTTALAVEHRLGFQGETPLALGGGLLLHMERYRTLVLEHLRGSGCYYEPVVLVADPALEAARAARELTR